ncbi:glycosyltransferase family 4 protein [Alsobacter sp. KACC 23698]|uniref:Glycosyltransferase family 4 protein n=1 Tax=Alsobacter sp. KACC 23698 TaxID=3149229 RepID=A0AAU7JHP6_9HYPH
MRVVFHAPLKPPDHPEPSGDRAMARLILVALRLAGVAAETPCGLRMFDRDGDERLTARLTEEARRQAGAYAREVRQRPTPERPRAVLSYHVHYKAPDVFGPAVASALGLPYLVAEGSRAPKRAHGPWSLGHALTEAALDRADAVLVMNPADREMLEAARPPGQRLLSFPPFLDAQAWPDASGQRGARAPDAPAALLAVAMMRPGDKVASYRLLAESLEEARDAAWTLDVVGDGAARAEVEAAFAPLRERVRFHGALGPDDLARRYAMADLLVWPAVREAYGMAFLEAALQGCPALAGDFGGVGTVVLDGVTGVLAPAGDARAFADALRRLLADRAALGTLGSAARRRVLASCSTAGAAQILRAALDDACATVQGPPP